MKTILWKEMREHARWVPLGAIPIIAVLIMVWRGSDVVLNGQAIGMLVGVISCPIAAALGILQCWADKRPAARALLIHRGITIDAVLLGKLLAGMLLYAAAVFLPMLGMALFIAAGGLEHRAAHPGSLLRATLSGLSAFAFWPAAMLVLHRDAWVVGSRLLPAVGAGVAIFLCFVFADQTLWFSIVLLVLSFVGFGAAARSVFSSSGGLATGAGRVSLALIVTIAILTGIFCAGATVETYRRAAARGDARYQHYSVSLGPDGEPWLNATRPGYVANDRTNWQIAKMISGTSVRDKLQPGPEDWEAPPQWSGSSYNLQYFARQRGLGLGDRFQHLQSFYPSTTTPGVGQRRDWVYDMKEDAILIYGEGKLHRWNLQASLRPPTAADSFRHPYHWHQQDDNGNYALICSTGVYRIPGNGDRAEVIYRLPPTSELRGLEVFSGQFRPFGVMLRVDDRIVLLESNLNPADEERATSLGVFTGVGEVFLTEVRLPNQLVNRTTWTLARAPNKAGSFVGLGHDKINDRQQFTWLQFNREGQIESQQLFEEDTSVVAGYEEFVIIGCFPPALFGVMAMGSAISDQGESLQNAWDSAKKDPARAATLVFLVSLQAVSGAGIALFCARRRRLERRSTRRWMLWGFLLGPAGGLALPAAYPRLVLDACVACRKTTRIDLSSCEHCAHSLDEPSRKGIEIIDNEASVKQQEPVTSSS